MAKTEFKVGETFQCGLIKLKCVKMKDCEKCYFEDYCILGLKQSKSIHGECLAEKRFDKKDVVFIKVKD